VRLFVSATSARPRCQEEAKLLLARGASVPDVYPMGNYSKQGGPWTNYHPRDQQSKATVAEAAMIL